MITFYELKQSINGCVSSSSWSLAEERGPVPMQRADQLFPILLVLSQKFCFLYSNSVVLDLSIWHFAIGCETGRFNSQSALPCVIVSLGKTLKPTHFYKTGKRKKLVGLTRFVLHTHAKKPEMSLSHPLIVSWCAPQVGQTNKVLKDLTGHQTEEKNVKHKWF